MLDGIIGGNKPKTDTTKTKDPVKGILGDILGSKKKQKDTVN